MIVGIYKVMKTILQEWQNSQKVLPVSLAWVIGEESLDFFMIKERNARHSKIT